MEKIEQDVSRIMGEVRKNGDSALKRFTKKYDGVDLESFQVSAKEIRDAMKSLRPETLEAMELACRNVRAFSEAQMRSLKDFEMEVMPGVFLGQKTVPIERVGVYAPGGLYPLFSSVIMACIPARVAGVKEIIICSPPSSGGSVSPLILAAAGMCGVSKVFRIGGAQAIAAMAFGTESVPKVQKIAGPGNRYVTEAKRQAFGSVGIDALAGPSEIVVIADRYSDPDFIVPELMAQKEHGPGSHAVLITDSAKVAKRVSKKCPDCEIIRARNLRSAAGIADRIAPEHLLLSVRNPRRYLGMLKNYGCLFMGKYSSVVLGDYVSGTSHILPTSGAAAYSEGVSVRTFIKQQSYQYITREGLGRLGPAAIELSSNEGLEWHGESLRRRLASDFRS